MTLIKLDNGDYLPTDNLGYIDHDNMVAYFKQPVIHYKDTYVTRRTMGLSVTENDCQRIAEAMNAEREVKLDGRKIAKAVDRAITDRTIRRLRGLTKHD